MKCPNCGRDYPTVIDECSACGLILAKWRAGQARPSRVQAGEEPTVPAVRRWEGWAWGGVALLAAVLLWALYGPEGGPPSPREAGKAASGPARLEEAAFDAFASGAGTALVMFYSDSCGICRAAMPAMSRLAEEGGGRWRVALVDVDASPGLRSRYGVRGVPVFLFLRDGREVFKAPGAPGPDTASIYSGIREVLLSVAGQEGGG